MFIASSIILYENVPTSLAFLTRILYTRQLEYRKLQYFIEHDIKKSYIKKQVSDYLEIIATKIINNKDYVNMHELQQKPDSVSGHDVN